MPGFASRKSKISGDRLSSLPESLQVHILSFLDTKQAVQTSLLSKQWVNLWTLRSDFDFVSSDNSLRSFDATIEKLFLLSDESNKINSFALSRTLDRKNLERVLDFVSSHRVQSLTITSCFSKEYECRLPMKRLCSFDFLQSLKLEYVLLDYSLRLKHLVTLHLGWVMFDHTSEDFSGCPNLESLTIKSCYRFFSAPRFDLVVLSPKLTKLTISNTYLGDSKIVLSTPRLTFFGFTGFDPVFLETCDMPLLHTIDMYILSDCSYWRDTLWIQKLITMLKRFSTAKVVRLSSSIIEILSRYPDILAKEPSPFGNLQSLNITKTKAFHFQIEDAMTYLVRNCPHAKVVRELPR